jgi:hypothetical protein
LKTVAGEKASCELPFLGIFFGKNEKSKRQMLTSKGAGYCTLFYEISVDEVFTIAIIFIFLILILLGVKGKK